MKNSQTDLRWQGIQLHFKVLNLFFFPFFICIKLFSVQVTILHCLGCLSHCTSTLSWPNWTSAAHNCTSLRSVEVTAYRNIMMLGTEYLIWSHDSAHCYLLSSYLCTTDNSNISLPALLKFTVKTQ